MLKVFVAYPSNPAQIGEVIERAKERARQYSRELAVETWKRTDAGGSELIAPIIESLTSSDIIVADITVLNFNVVYELGYAIGLGKRVLPITNGAINGDAAMIPEIGIFDTLLHQPYNNSDELFAMLEVAEPGKRLATDFPFADFPLYMVFPEVKTDDVSQLITRAKKAGLRTRTFDPAEQPRLGAAEAVRAVASSYGVVLPLLATGMAEAKNHNIRVAFVAGIAHGMGKPTLLLKKGDWAAPLDIRDEVSSYQTETQLNGLFQEFASQVHDARFSDPPRPAGAGNKLAELDLGDPAAENEAGQLEEYFVERDEFRQVLNGQANIVIGRKGSGKTAVFVQVLERLRTARAKIVIDLSPESYQLRKLKDVVLKCLAAGSKEYLLAAFWEYVLLLEICSKILEKDREVHKRDHTLFEPYQRLLKFYKEESVSQGIDFSDRLVRLIDRIVVRFSAEIGNSEDITLAEDQITNLLYETTLADLRREVEAYARNKDSIHVLFDNLDKSWNANGLDPSDVIMIRTLLDASRKLTRDFRHAGTDFRCIVFLRNDIYDMLIEKTPDRGKESRVLVDWMQQDLLKQMIRMRLIFNGADTAQQIDALWHPFCVDMVQGENSLSYMIDRSLMRPRYLLRLINHCKANAINYGRDRIDEEDIQRGLSVYSTDIITEIDHEIRDVRPDAAETLYLFLGEQREMKKSEIIGFIAQKNVDAAQQTQIFELLLWHGVLGFKRGRDEVSFIYDVNYDLRRLTGMMEKTGGNDPPMLINPAFWSGLELR